MVSFGFLLASKSEITLQIHVRDLKGGPHEYFKKASHRCSVYNV